MRAGRPRTGRSSPPVPARISTKALRSSSGSRDQGELRLLVQAGQFGLASRDLLARHLGHVGVAEHVARSGHVALHLLVAAVGADQLAGL